MDRTEAAADFSVSEKERVLIAQIARLGREKLAPRAARYDREASFPFENYADLRQEGLLGLCVPERYGGRGASIMIWARHAKPSITGICTSSVITCGSKDFTRASASAPSRATGPGCASAPPTAAGPWWRRSARSTAPGSSRRRPPSASRPSTTCS